MAGNLWMKEQKGLEAASRSMKGELMGQEGQVTF